MQGKVRNKDWVPMKEKGEQTHRMIRGIYYVRSPTPGVWKTIQEIKDLWKDNGICLVIYPFSARNSLNGLILAKKIFIR